MNSTKVSLLVQCNNLPKRDSFSLSDPRVFLSVRAPGSTTYSVVCSTEQIRNNHNPSFVTPLILDYFFQEIQYLRFDVYDIDSASTNLRDHDLLGSAETTLGAIVAAPHGAFIARLSRRPGEVTATGPLAPEIIIRATDASRPKFRIDLTLAGSNLDKKDVFGKSDPYVLMYASTPSGDTKNMPVLYKTEIIMKTLSPSWRPFTINVDESDAGAHFVFKVYDYDENSQHDLIGISSAMSLTSLRELHAALQIPLINPKKVGKKSYSNSGMLVIQRCVVTRVPSFLEYVRGGMSLNFSVAVDFTASNGDPALPTSLHYHNPQYPNEYEQAICAIGNVIQDYDSDKMFPALGFGGRLPDGTVSFNFTMNGSPSPFCAGVGGVLQAYRAALQNVRLAGPTNFAPLIRYTVACTVGQPPGLSQQSQFFNVLLILTDGDISDLKDTKDAIVEASEYPIAIIIVGVGGSNFHQMAYLDADNNKKGLQHSNGKYAKRDIVQFVPFRKFKHTSPDRLAADVLAELPKTVVEYMLSRGIAPNPPINA